MFERFTDRARRAIILAQEEAKRLRHNAVGTEHILLGLIREGEGVAARVLETAGAGLERTRAEVVRLLEQKGATAPAPDRPRPSEAIWRVVPNVKSSAFDESRKFYSDFLGF